MQQIDFHMHSNASFDGTASATDMCAAAVSRGLYAVAITDHVDLIGYAQTGEDRLAMSREGADAAKVAFAGKLRVARGVELGGIVDDPVGAARVLTARDYDVVIGSVHILPDGTDPYSCRLDASRVNQALDGYFESCRRLAHADGFDILGHLTYPLRYITAEACPQDLSRWGDVIDDTLATLAAKGRALEINTSGLRRESYRRTDPPAQIVRRFRELGGQYLTVGADAHYTQDVGAGFEEAVTIAKQAGFTGLTCYFDHKPEFLPFD